MDIHNNRFVATMKMILLLNRLKKNQIGLLYTENIVFMNSEIHHFKFYFNVCLRKVT